MITDTAYEGRVYVTTWRIDGREYGESFLTRKEAESCARSNGRNGDGTEGQVHAASQFPVKAAG